MLAIFKKEMRSYFINPVGYVFLGVFLTVAAGLCTYTTLQSRFSPALGEEAGRIFAAMTGGRYDRVLLTGTDLPQMRSSHLERGFEALEEADVAIGATPDGGYYLIGMKEAHPEVFRVPGYGGSSVYENTLAAIRSSGLTVQPALPCADVDTPEDLKNLRPAQDTATARCLAEFKEEGTAL